MTLIEGQGWQLWNEILPRWENFAEMLKTAATGFSHAAAAGNLFLGIFPDFFCIYVWFFWIPPGEKTLQKCWKRLQRGSLMKLLLGTFFLGFFLDFLAFLSHFFGFLLVRKLCRIVENGCNWVLSCSCCWENHCAMRRLPLNVISPANMYHILSTHILLDFFWFLWGIPFCFFGFLMQLLGTIAQCGFCSKCYPPPIYILSTHILLPPKTCTMQALGQNTQWKVPFSEGGALNIQAILPYPIFCWLPIRHLCPEMSAQCSCVLPYTSKSRQMPKREFYKLVPVCFSSDGILLLDEHSTSENANVCFNTQKPTNVQERVLQTSSCSFLIW